MEKNLNETKIIELFESDFNAKSVLYSDSVELSNGFPEEVIANIIKCTIRGSVAYVKEIENATDIVAIHIVDEKNNFYGALVVSKETDDEGKDSYTLSIINDEAEYDERKSADEFDKIVEANDPSYVKFLADFLAVNSGKMSKDGQGVSVKDNAGFMYVVLLAFFMAYKTYANNLTDDEVKEDNGVTVNFDDEMKISVTEVDGKRVVTVEPGTALKTFIKDDKANQ